MQITKGDPARNSSMCFHEQLAIYYITDQTCQVETFENVNTPV
jgi:hypothetical protein